MERNSMIEALVMISLLAENLAKQLMVEEELEKQPTVAIKVVCRKKNAEDASPELPAVLADLNETLHTVADALEQEVHSYAERKRTVCYRGDEPALLNRYEVFVDAKDVSAETQIDGETVQISDEDYLGLLMEKGAENLVPSQK